MRDAIEYWSVVAARGVARRLPEPVVDALGAGIGLTFYLADWQHRRVALANLEQCFPNKTAAERRAIARGTFKHFGRVLLKLLTFSALTPEQMMAASEYEGDERVRLAYAKGKGILFFTGHFGFWELHALAHAVKLRPIGVTSKERVRALPDVPSLSETPALARYELNNWFGLFAPSGVAPGVMQTLHSAAVKALSSPELQARLVEQGGIPSPGTPEAFRTLIFGDWQKFAQIIKDVGIPMEG